MSIELLWVCALALSLFASILSGVPVMLAIAGAPIVIAFAASLFGYFDLSYLAAFPQRVFGIMTNPLFVAIPLFVLMGILLEQSRQAEKLLLNITRLMGETQSNLALAVLFVSALIAASTGIIGATIVMLGMISLPTMMKAGIPTRFSSGLICASGTLGQIIPPSIVLILLGDQISNAYLEAQQNIGNFAPDPVSVGDLFAGALLPGLLLVSLYALYSLYALRCSDNGTDVSQTVQHPPAAHPEDIGLVDLLSIERTQQSASVVSLLTEIIPPVMLMVAVLGSILLGVATPTEAASIGVAGTVLITARNLQGTKLPVALIVRCTLAALVTLIFLHTMDVAALNVLSPFVAIALMAGLALCLYALAIHGVLKKSLSKTVEISAMIFGIITAASMLSLVFRGFGGDEMVADLLTHLPGGQWTLLLITMLTIFLLGFVLEFVEIVFIVIPIVGPILLQTDIHPVWFGILVALNIQTSFLTPPFGFALFYYRSVAPTSISTLEIYRAVVPFVILQLITIAVVIAFPALATWLPGVLFR